MEEDLLKSNNLEALKNFIIRDLDIKKYLAKLAPNFTDNSNESTKINYVDKLYNSLNDFKFLFNSSLKDFKMEKDVEKSIEEFFSKLKSNLAIGSFDMVSCQSIFQENFSGMSQNLIENVKYKFVGYTGYGEPQLIPLINQANTINELLHICHSYIMNNDEILSSITKLDEKNNNFDDPIILYGERTEISENLFKNFPLNLKVSKTDIISLPNQILMMIRGRGHALTLDINTSEDKPFVKYFIPKICNVDMVRALPGIDKNNLSGNGASGSFQCEKQDFLEKLFDFIEKVPTDHDIPKEQDNLNRENETFFSREAVKQLTVTEGTAGIKFSNAKKLEFIVKHFFRNLKCKTPDTPNNTQGVNTDER